MGSLTSVIAVFCMLGASPGWAQKSGQSITLVHGKVVSAENTQVQSAAGGDCVVVENAGSNQANIRRVTQTYCAPESQAVVAELQDEMMEEAEECLAAKRELAAAQTDEAFDRAVRKTEILCNS